MIKNALRRIHSLPSHYSAIHRLANLEDGDYIIKNVPYVCQFASPELTKDILEKRFIAEDDPNWNIFGYRTRKESAYWAWRQCGVCCVKMVLDFHRINRQVAELTKEGVDLDGYNIENDSGWYYKPIAKLLERYNLIAKIMPHLTVEVLAELLLREKLAIISVNPEIIRGDTKITSHKKSGHLVLAVGFRIHNKQVTGLFVNNPSGKSEAMQVYAFIPIERFNNAYGQRGIVVSGALHRNK